MAKCLVGTSGYGYGHRRGPFYPEDLPAEERLAFYARHFSAVEINSTFYRLPGSSAFMGGKSKAREGFTMARGRPIHHPLEEAQGPLGVLELPIACQAAGGAPRGARGGLLHP